jgi:hypothetical protein
MKTFLRYATRSSEESCANFYVFDNTHDRTYLPVTSRSWSKFAEDLLLDAASVREWGAVVVFVSPYYGNLRKELDHWVRALMLCNRHDRSWTVFTPAPAGFEIDDAAMIQVVVEPSLKLSNRPFIEEPKQAESEDIGLSNLQKWKRFRNQLLKELPPEILAMDVIPHEFITKETLTANPEGKDLMCEAALWGHLADFHPDLLTWDMLAWGIERDPGSTPLRGAAKYDHLDQVPPSACVEHYQEAKEIVIAAVHKSQNFGRAERWATARRWLLKVLLHGSTIQPCAIERATLDLQAIAVEAVRSGTAVRISSNFTSLPISSLLEGEDRIAHWLRRYCETKTEDYLDFALTEAYLQEFLPSSEESPE